MEHSKVSLDFCLGIVAGRLAGGVVIVARVDH